MEQEAVMSGKYVRVDDVMEEQGLLLRLPYRESEEQSEKRSSKMSEAMVDFIRRRFMTRQ